LGLPLCHTPQHRAWTLSLDVGDHGKGKTKACRRVAIGMWLDFVQPSLMQRAQGVV
jgi:hypothetical protein